MGRFTVWVFTAALVWASPAAAATTCHEQAGTAQQGDKSAAKPGEPSKPERRPKFWQGDSKTELGLSDLQSAEIEQIFKTTVPKLEALQQKLDKLEDALAKMTRDNTADLATLAQQLDSVNAARAEFTKTRTLMLYRMRGVLSSEQRLKLQAMKDRWDAAHRKTNEPGRR